MRRAAWLAWLAAVTGCLHTPARGRDAAAQAGGPSDGWSLVWSDEFDGDRLDRTRWTPQLGNGFWGADSATYVSGWGNAELQCYTAEPTNVQVGGGVLRIIAQRDTVRDVASRDSSARCAYTSARLITKSLDGRALFAQTYGRFVFRARLPEGRGLWPALWLLPLAEHYGTWAASGEIDVMEARGEVPTRVLGTLHYGDRWPGNVHTGDSLELPRGGRISQFHDYAIEWEPGEIRWLVDDSLYQTQRRWFSGPRRDEGGTRRGGAPFDQPFHLVMNLAVGGNFLGSPDASTPFPAAMEVDWVRVYEAAPVRRAPPMPALP